MEYFNRVERLLGSGTMTFLEQTSVIIFGVGGVGSWTAEALVRSGVSHITIVDADVVAATNINRQLMATSATIGKPKVDVLRDRLLEINPQAEITSVYKMYDAETAGEFNLSDYDYVVDAIDSLSAKALLILNTCNSHARLLSSMGAALKLDPTRVKVAEFWNVKGCPLAAALRRRFKKTGIMPRKKFKCAYSDELLTNQGQTATEDTAKSYGKIAINGALCHITAIFGLTLAGLIVQDINLKSRQAQT